MPATTLSNLVCPPGTYGLAVVWVPGEVYAVAADWTRADAPVYTYHPYSVPRGWHESIHRVGGFWDNPHEALRYIVRAAVEASEDEVYDLVRGAVEIEDLNGEW